MLENILKDDPVYRQLKDEVEDYCGPVLVSGCTDTAKWHLTSLIGNHKKKQFKIIIVPDENKARQWVEASHFFGEKVQYIPAKDPLFYTADVHGNAIARDRMLAIKKIVDISGYCTGNDTDNNNDTGRRERDICDKNRCLYLNWHITDI